MQNLSLIRHYSARLAAGLLVMMLAPALAHTQAGSPNAGSEYFAEADRIFSSNSNSSAIGLVEKGWTAVRSAGPLAPGFLDGVYTAVRLFHVYGWDLRAESVYAESIHACDGAALRPARLRLIYMFAQDLIGQKEYVKAESVLRSALQTEESSVEKSGLYVAFLQSLAFVREQEGDLEDAERLYRSTLTYGGPDLSGVVMDRVIFCPGPRLPMIGTPLDIVAAFLVNHGRLAEAEQIFRDQLTLAGRDPNRRLSALRQLSGFLAYHGSKTEAVVLQEQILELVKAAHRQSPELNYAVTAEQSTLARYEVDAGQKEEARQMLQTSLLEAEKNKGKGSPEYRNALAYLFDNRRYAGDYAMAETLARQQLQLARESEEPDPIALSSALSNLATVRKSQGFEAESTELQKQANDAVKQTGAPRWMEVQARFAAAGDMIKEGNAAQALAAIEEATTALSPLRQDELFSFFQVAQSFLAFQHGGEATRVAALALSIMERQGNDPRWSYSLVNWANFYRGQLNDPDSAAALLDKAESLIRDCCGEKSPRLEPLLRERAWMQAAGDKESEIAGLEHLRDFQIAVYGAGNQAVEETTRQLADLHARLGKWDQAARLYKQTLTICARRTGGQGPEYDSLLDRVSQQLRSYAGLRTTLEVTAPAKSRVASAVGSEQAETLPDKHRQILDILNQMSATAQ